jgi:hypothetical protein
MFVVRVTYVDGREAWLCKGVSDERIEFFKRADAEDAALFILKKGFAEGAVMAVSVVAL